MMAFHGHCEQVVVPHDVRRALTVFHFDSHRLPFPNLFVQFLGEENMHEMSTKRSESHRLARYLASLRFCQCCDNKGASPQVASFHRPLGRKLGDVMSCLVLSCSCILFGASSIKRCPSLMHVSSNTLVSIMLEHSAAKPSPECFNGVLEYFIPLAHAVPRPG
jgi:hypothetical protein